MRSKMLFILPAILVLLSLTTTIRPVRAFDTDTHYGLKYYLLLKVGFTPAEADIIAMADYSMDYGETAPGLAYTYNNPKWHALASPSENDKRQAELWQIAQNAIVTGKTPEEKLIPFGQFLHFLEDRLTHEYYGSVYGHLSSGHSVDYLSYYDLDTTLRSAITNWLDFIGQEFLLYKGKVGNSVTWPNVRDTVKKLQDVNPYHWYCSPDYGRAREVLQNAIQNEINKAWSIPFPAKPYKYDQFGKLIGMAIPQKFSFSSVGVAYNDITIQNAILAIQNAPFLPAFPEASVAVNLLYNFRSDQEAMDPSIDSLRYAITNMSGLAKWDIWVCNKTTDMVLLMLDSVFQRESHVLYLRNVAGLSGVGDKLQQAYETLALAEPEIEKMEAIPSAANYESLSDNLASAWSYERDAELSALIILGDVAITNVTPLKTIIDQGFNASINVTVMNQGEVAETFNVTTYANTTAIQTLNIINLQPGNSTTTTFTWNTTSFAKGNYTISAVADTVPGETDTADNTLVDGYVFVTILQGDINSDGTVDIYDAILLANAYNSKPDDPNWNTNADINSDNVVDIYDAILLANNYGKST